MKLIIWGLVIVALCYAAYSGMIAVWSYIAVNNAVDEVIARDGIDAVPAPEIKKRILNSTNEAGVPLAGRDEALRPASASRPPGRERQPASSPRGRDPRRAGSPPRTSPTT